MICESFIVNNMRLLEGNIVKKYNGLVMMVDKAGAAAFMSRKKQVCWDARAIGFHLQLYYVDRGLLLAVGGTQAEIRGNRIGGYLKLCTRIWCLRRDWL